MLFTMAWRNLWRRKRRTIITVFSVAFGVWLAVTFTGMGGYSYNNMIDTSARMGFGHLTLHPTGWLESLGLEERIQDAEAAEKKLESTPGVTGAYVRIMGQAMFATAGKSAGGVFLGIDPTDENRRVNLFVRSISEGELFAPDDLRGIVVGKLMAEKLDLRLGKRVVYTLVDVNGEIVSEVAKVRGIFETGVDGVDGSFALLPIDRVRRTLGYGSGAASMVAFFIDDHRKASVFEDRLTGSFGPNEEVSTWRRTQNSIAGLVEIDRSINYMFQLLIGILIGAGVLNTILMSVLERRREFGVMMAIGTTPGQLFSLVSVEAFLVGVVGLIAGVIMTIPWYAYMTRVGIDFSSLYGEKLEAGGVLMESVIKLRLYPESAAAILIGVFLLTMLAGLYPAYQAGREPPVETLKEV